MMEDCDRIKQGIEEMKDLIVIKANEVVCKDNRDLKKQLKQARLEIRTLSLLLNKARLQIKTAKSEK